MTDPQFDPSKPFERAPDFSVEVVGAHPEARMSAARPQVTFGADEIAFPDTPNKERNRDDNSLFGMPPEFAALSTLAIGRAIGAAGLTAAGRAVAGLKASAGQVAPVLKYEATKHALRAFGIPDTLAIPAAMVVAGYKSGAKAESAVAADAAHLDRSVAVPAGSLTPQQLQGRILQGTGEAPAVVRGAAKGPVGVTAAEPAVVAKPSMSAAETGEYLKLRAMGKTDAQARDALAAAREFLAKVGGATDAEAAAAIKKRNYKS